MTARTRSERIRAWLARQRHPVTVRDVLEAVEPDGDVNVFAATLSSMAKAGMVDGAKLGQRRYYVLVRVPDRPQQRNSRPITGRAHRIREWLAKHDRGFTRRELQAAVDQNASGPQFAASLCVMVKQGHVHRAREGQMVCYARTATLAKAQLREELARQRRPDRAAPAAKPKRATKPKPRPAPPARDVPRALAPAPKAPPPPNETLRATIGTLARSRPGHRPAPVTCSLAGIPDQQRQASEQIAADIAAFEAGGGRIEKLGPTQFFTRIGAANHYPPRRPRTGTTDLDDDA